MGDGHAMTDPVPDSEVEWFRVAEKDELAEGRVTTVVAGKRSIALTRCSGRYGALDNHCPHQGGPLGEGSIEGGLLRCPWHGYDYDPLTGRAPGEHADHVVTYPVEERADGVYIALPVQAPHERTVSDLIVDTLLAWGITHVFGIVGHSNLGFADALRRAESRGDLTFIGVRHEGAAAFAVSAFGKLTGRPAACFAIAGPGSTNLLTGLYDAKVDRSPALAISGQVPSSVYGRGAFQDLDLHSAFSDVADYSVTVTSGSNYSELAAIAMKTAVVGRGVAHLILPDEVQVQPALSGTPGSAVGRVSDHRIAPPADSFQAAVSQIDSAKRPVIIVGHGARFDMDAVISFAEHLGAPVLTTFKAKGQISDHHELGCGVLGRSGTPVASWIMNESDLLIVFGASFSNHTGIATYKPIVQVDFDAMALGRFHPVTVPVLGDVGVTAHQFRAACADHVERDDQRTDVAKRWSIWREEKRRRCGDNHGNGINSAVVFDTLSRLVPSDATISVDVGNHAYSFGRYFECSQQSILMSGYLGSIGFGFPAAMGACAAAPERAPIAITGDGGFGQYLADFTTAVKYGMPITHVVLNNSELGKISKEQRGVEMEVWQTSLLNPHFAAFASDCGGLGIRVESVDELEDAITRALHYSGPALVEVITDVNLV